MSEKIILPLGEPEPSAPTTEEIAAGLQQAEAFLRDRVPHLGRLFGMDLNIRLGNKWATNMEAGSNDVTADPRFFIEKGYTPDMAIYATLHEVAAHLREKVIEPKLTRRIIGFAKQGKPQAIFYNTFTDIAGNNLIHAAFPRMRSVATQLYSEKLFAGTDYTQIPRHLQFLYKVIRQEMIPDSETAVLPEVDAPIAELRNYQGQGDVIKYSTAVAKSAYEAMGGEERFGIWTAIIYPVYEKLIELDRQDSSRQSQSGGKGQGNGENQQGTQSQVSDKPKDQPQSDSERFSSYYEDYKQSHHPEPMSEEEHDKLYQHAKEHAQSSAKPNSPLSRQREHERTLDKKVRDETGHSLQEQRRYNAEIVRWRSAIQKMRDVFQHVINERVAQKRGLSRRTFTDGAVLDPDRLVQTVIDVRSNIEEPEAFKNYVVKRGEARSIGKTDYVFMFDVSGSMGRKNAVNAASSVVIGLEGLAALQRDVAEAEAVHKADIELDIRTAIYIFGDEAACVKPLSTTVTLKERLDTYAAVIDPHGGNTRDFLALEEIARWPSESDRRRMLIVVSDGGSNDSARARHAIEKLRDQGWFVYGISIGSDEAEHLYHPTARRVDDPDKLQTTIHDFIEATIS